MGIFAPTLAVNAQTALVATNETTTSATYANLATTTDTVTVTVGASGVVLVTINSYIQGSAGNGNYFVGIDVSGANTIAAADDRCIMFMAYGANTFGYYSGAFVYTGLSSGSTVFKLKYKASTGTGTFQNRRISAVPF